MPTTDDLRRALTLATSPDSLDFFYDHLTSPDWIPALRETGLLADPPEPIEQGGGILFPGWGLSRYLVRVAPQAPSLAAGALGDIETTANPRIQRDIVDALVVMPPEHAVAFVPYVARWIHHPYRIGLDQSAAQLAEILIAANARQPALDLVCSLAMLVQPEGWPDEQPWVALDDYEYGEQVPRLARASAAFGLDGANLLAEELERFLAAEYRATENQPQRDLSFIWRPAIEDHEQNEDFDRHAKLLVAVRDAFVSAVDVGGELLAPSVRALLARPWAALRRLGMFLLIRFGDQDLDLVASTLTDPALFGDSDVHHEFYGLASAFFGRLPPEAQLRYIELVDEVPARLSGDDEPEVAQRRQRWWARNRLGAVAESLGAGPRNRYDGLVAEFGPEEHPDFLTYHSSWTGPTSSMSEADLAALHPDALVTYLETWRPDETDERRASPEGLARVITEIVQKSPASYTASAPRYINLEPAYARGLLFGFRQALRAGQVFDWEPVLELCAAIVRQPEGADEAAVDRGRDPGWAWARTEVAHLLDTGLEDRLGALPIGEREGVWTVVEILVEDPDPSPESEARFGPPNMDPLTYSINTTRGVAMHSVCAYAAWLWRHAGSDTGWRLSAELPQVARVLEAHLDIASDPSVAVRAVYGWWLAWLIAMDSLWIEQHLDRLLGDLSTPPELAAWETYLVHSSADNASYGVLSDYYRRYATRLAGLDDARGRISHVEPVERFVDHLVRFRDRVPPEDGPLDIMLRSGRPWLVRAIVENSGRILQRASEIPGDVAASLQALWRRIRETADRRDDPAIRLALAPFGWWFTSPLPAEWTLPEVLRVLDGGAAIDPAFLVLERLGQVADEFPDLALRALEQIVAREEQGWTLRTHEVDIRRVLEAALRADDPMLRTRAEALTHRLGRLGLQGLRSLLAGDASV